MFWGGASSSSSGYSSSRSASPGASGIGPLIIIHFCSISDLVMGVVRTATAPEEYAASFAFSNLDLLTTKIILASGSLSRISNAATCPSMVGRFSPKNTSLGFNLMYRSTARSPSSQISETHPL